MAGFRVSVAGCNMQAQYQVSKRDAALTAELVMLFGLSDAVS